MELDRSCQGIRYVTHGVFFRKVVMSCVFGGGEGTSNTDAMVGNCPKATYCYAIMQYKIASKCHWSFVIWVNKKFDVLFSILTGTAFGECSTSGGPAKLPWVQTKKTQRQQLELNSNDLVVSSKFMQDLFSLCTTNALTYLSAVGIEAKYWVSWLMNVWRRIMKVPWIRGFAQ